MTPRPLSAGLEDVLNTGELVLPLHLPAARQSLQVLAGNPSIDEVCTLCSHDPVLAATLFRLANGAFYQGLAPVSGLDEALTRLGLEPAVATLRSYSAAAVAAPPGILLADYLPKLWQHSLGCAIGAGWLAERCGYRTLVGPAHLAGLLHDLGKFALLAGLEQLAADESVAALLVPQLIATILASRHVETGLRLRSEWGLPEAFAPVMAGHHDKGEEGRELLTILVRLANQGCHKLGLGWDNEPGMLLPTTAEAQFLGLDEIALAEFEIMLEDRFGVTAPPLALGA